MVGVDASLLWDPLSALMTLIVTGSRRADSHVYSVGYMHGDERYPRFFGYLNLFIASMLTLVLADNFGLMFVGWELVGLLVLLAHQLLVHQTVGRGSGQEGLHRQPNRRLGLSRRTLMLIFAAFGTLDFGVVFGEARRPAEHVGMATAITLLLFVGATGKSAQIPLYIWLPDAMEGPPRSRRSSTPRRW